MACASDGGTSSYEQERDHFFCLTCLLFNVGNKTLRCFFKNSWPKVNGTGAVWSDTPADGAQFLALSKGVKLPPNERSAIQNGDTNEWDLTLLLKVLMFSKFASPAPGFVLPSSQEFDWLDEIREIRNTLIGHAKDTTLPKVVFVAAWKQATMILENFGATKEEIAAVQNDIERTRREAEEYGQRLLEAEEREKKVVEHLKTVDERLVNIEKNQSDFYQEITQNMKQGTVQGEAKNGASSHDVQPVVHWNINVNAASGAHIAFSDLVNAVGHSGKAAAVSQFVKQGSAMVVKDHEAESNTHLSLSCGDIVAILGLIGDCWLVSKDNKEGLVPYDCLRLTSFYNCKDVPTETPVSKSDHYSQIGQKSDSDTKGQNQYLYDFFEKEDEYEELPVETLAEAPETVQDQQTGIAKGKLQDDCNICDKDYGDPEDPVDVEDGSSSDEYECGTEYTSVTQVDFESYCARKSVRAKKKDLSYDQLLPSYKKTYLSGEWKAMPLSEVITSKVEGISDEDWGAEKLFADPDEYLQRMSSSGGDIKSKVEQKFLQEILPSLEHECKKSDLHSDEIYQILAKLSCCRHSQSTVKHSLYLLRHLLVKDKLELANSRTVMKIERTLRASFAADGLFNLESTAAQRLRLMVYSKVLCLLVICFCKGFLTSQSMDSEYLENLEALHEKLSKCFSGKTHKKKDRLLHAADLTVKSLKWILTDKKPTNQPRESLESFKDLLSNFDSVSEKDVSRYVKELCNSGKFCLYIVLCCIEHEIRSDPNALNLLFLIVDRMTKKKAPDWKFFTSVSGILTNATMTNRNKDIRVGAGWKLAEYLQATKIKKTAEVVEAIERKMSRVLFSPDPPVRVSLARVYHAQGVKSISAEQIMNFLCWFYRNQALERKKIIRESKNDVVYLGSFQGEKVAIKALRPCMLELRDIESDEVKRIKRAFITEAYILRRLNELTIHPNIIRLLCCNTVRIPYHLITDYLSRGDLLKYLRQDCRSETPLRELAQLCQWCVEILDALVFLSKYKIVHRKIMARSVFVGEDEVCKLSGFSAAQKESDVYAYASSVVPLDSSEMERIRWLAPEVLTQGRYSKASDVWAFGVLMHEVFSFGCDPFRPGRNGRPVDEDVRVVDMILLGFPIPRLPCFNAKIYKLMETCWRKEPSKRKPVEQLRGDLFKLQLEFMRSDTQFPGRPPPLFPGLQPANEEEAMKRNEELRQLLRSKRKAPPKVNVCTRSGSECYEPPEAIQQAPMSKSVKQVHNTRIPPPPLPPSLKPGKQEAGSECYLSPEAIQQAPMSKSVKQVHFTRLPPPPLPPSLIPGKQEAGSECYESPEAIQHVQAPMSKSVKRVHNTRLPPPPLPPPPLPPPLPPLLIPGKQEAGSECYESPEAMQHVQAPISKSVKRVHNTRLPPPPLPPPLPPSLIPGKQEAASDSELYESPEAFQQAPTSAFVKQLQFARRPLPPPLKPAASDSELYESPEGIQQAPMSKFVKHVQRGVPIPPPSSLTKMPLNRDAVVAFLEKFHGKKLTRRISQAASDSELYESPEGIQQTPMSKFVKHVQRGVLIPPPSSLTKMPLNRDAVVAFLEKFHGKKHTRRISQACFLATANISCWSKDSERPTFKFPKGCQIAVFRELDSDWWEGKSLKTGAFGHIQKNHVTMSEDRVKVKLMEEIVTEENRSHLENVRTLLEGNDSFVKITVIEPYGPKRMRMVSQFGEKGNLLEYLSSTVNKAYSDCITFLCQVASAVEFLHSKSIIHCDIQAINVFVLSSDKVQLGQLGRCKQLTLPDDKASHAPCAIQQAMPEELLQWSPPEVIQNGSYSQASDVWSFAIFGWEIFENCEQFYDVSSSCPFHFIEDMDEKEAGLELLAHLKKGMRLPQPNGCPDWLFMLLAVCLKYFPGDRPTMNTVRDNLINRKSTIEMPKETDKGKLLSEIWDDMNTLSRDQQSTIQKFPSLPPPPGPPPPPPPQLPPCDQNSIGRSSHEDLYDTYDAYVAGPTYSNAQEINVVSTSCEEDQYAPLVDDKECAYTYLTHASTETTPGLKLSTASSPFEYLMTSGSLDRKENSAEDSTSRNGGDTPFSELTQREVPADKANNKNESPDETRTVTPVVCEKWTLSRDDIVLNKRIGSGLYGEIFEGYLRSFNMPVAIKTFKKNVTETAKERFFAEAEFLKKYNHPNIVRLIGVCAEKEPLFIVTELMPSGDLLSFLRKNGKELNQKILMKFMTQAASGMEYLASKNCINRDVAARNCLIGEGYLLKICDFYMAREVEGVYEAREMKEVPVKWTAPEALNEGRFSTKSDVWSFGVLLWETFSLGVTPYCGFTNKQCHTMVDGGYRMSSPQGTPPGVYQIMSDCWNAEPRLRPSFSEILKSLKAIEEVLFVEVAYI